MPCHSRWKGVCWRFDCLELEPELTADSNKDTCTISVTATCANRHSFYECSCCTCLCRKVITSIHILHPSNCQWHWPWTSQAVLTDSKKQSTPQHHKTTVCPERHIISKDTTKSTMFVDRKKRVGGHSYIFPIPSFSIQTFLSESSYVD